MICKPFILKFTRKVDGKITAINMSRVDTITENDEDATAADLWFTDGSRVTVTQSVDEIATRPEWISS